MKVTVVLDKEFGAGKAPRVEDAFWLIESPANKAFADQLRQAPNCDPNSALFSVGDTVSVSDAAVSTFFNVIEHHPDWSEIEFVGISPDKALKTALTREGASFSETAKGFIVKSAD